MKTTVVILFAFAAVISRATAADYGLDPAARSDSVWFQSTARLEFIQGKTAAVEGRLRFDPDNAQAGASGRLIVDMRTLRTGIEKRDEHMRNRHLHTDEFPYAWFELLGLSDMPARLAVDSNYEGSAVGMFYIHGVKRKLNAEIKFSRRQEGERPEEIEVVISFSLNLDDYKIPRPKALFLKLAETIEVEIHLSFRRDLKAGPFDLPEWPETE